MNPTVGRNAKIWAKALSAPTVATIAIGGLFQPFFGFGVPALIVFALAMNFRSRRSFCAGVCPNGVALSALKPVSRHRRIPLAFVRPSSRRLLCGVMLFCMIGLFARGYPDYYAIGRSFWWIYIIALSVGIVFGVLYRPRAWCAVCPLGTLQDTVSDARRGAAE